MPRTVDQWVASLAKQLHDVPEDAREATARELVRGVQELQRTSPRRQRPKLVRAGPSLYHSIKIERQAHHVYTDHPGAEILERGGKITPRGQFLRIPLTRDFRSFGGASYTIPIRNGGRLVFEAGSRKPKALLLRRVFVRPRKWVSRAIDAAQEGAEQRILSSILPGER